MDKEVFNLRTTAAAAPPAASRTIADLQQSLSGIEARRRRQGRAGTTNYPMDQDGTTHLTQLATVAVLTAARSRKFPTVKAATSTITIELTVIRRTMSALTLRDIGA